MSVRILALTLFAVLGASAVGCMPSMINNTIQENYRHKEREKELDAKIAEQKTAAATPAAPSAVAQAQPDAPTK